MTESGGKQTTSSERSDRERWAVRWAEPDSGTRAPSRWVLERCLELPAALSLCDLACGRGRHAVPLARAGRTVIGVDFVERAVRVSAAIDDGSAGRVLGVVA